MRQEDLTHLRVPSIEGEAERSVGPYELDGVENLLGGSILVFDETVADGVVDGGEERAVLSVVGEVDHLRDTHQGFVLVEGTCAGGRNSDAVSIEVCVVMKGGGY